MHEEEPAASHAVASAAPGVTATDLKQWAYCPRIPFYRHVLPVRAAPTYRMQRGKDVQAAVEALERRRGFRAYGMRDGGALGNHRGRRNWNGGTRGGSARSRKASGKSRAAESTTAMQLPR